MTALELDTVSMPFVGKLVTLIVRFAAVSSVSLTCDEKSIRLVSVIASVNVVDDGLKLVVIIPTATAALDLL